jgi:hypothetical protein
VVGSWKLWTDGWIVSGLGFGGMGIGELREERGGVNWLVGDWMVGGMDICNYSKVMAEGQLDTFLCPILLCSTWMELCLSCS